jgi:hypothetical protein
MMMDDGFDWVWEWVKILKDRPQIGMASFSIIVTICFFATPPPVGFLFVSRYVE